MAVTDEQINSLTEYLRTPEGAERAARDPVAVVGEHGVHVAAEHVEDFTAAVTVLSAPTATDLEAALGDPSHPDTSQAFLGITATKCQGCKWAISAGITAGAVLAVGLVAGVVITTGGADAAAAPAEVIALADAGIAVMAEASGVEAALIGNWFRESLDEKKDKTKVISYITQKICEHRGDCP